jgi:hypothetical protein
MQCDVNGKEINYFGKIKKSFEFTPSFHLIEILLIFKFLVFLGLMKLFLHSFIQY